MAKQFFHISGDGKVARNVYVTFIETVSAISGTVIFAVSNKMNNFQRKTPNYFNKDIQENSK